MLYLLEFATVLSTVKMLPTKDLARTVLMITYIAEWDVFVFIHRNVATVEKIVQMEVTKLLAVSRTNYIFFCLHYRKKNLKVKVVVNRL